MPDSQYKIASRASHQLLAVLQSHIGSGRGITAHALAATLCMQERQVRHQITDLREDGIAVCGTPQHGYYIAETAEELQATCDFLRGRALHSLMLESRLRKVSLNELLGQMRLNT